MTRRRLAPFLLPGLTAASVQLRITAEGRTSVRGVDPTYVTLEPNGPRCGPRCKRGTVTFSLTQASRVEAP
jgi:hypothetical protein